MQSLAPTASSDYSLWKVTKKIKQVKKPPPLRTSQGTWARNNVEKVHAFVEHLARGFQPHPSENEPEEEALTQLEPPINRLKRAEVQEIIRLRPHHGRIIKELLIEVTVNTVYA
jgi:hypothetical protein